jgi:hypothetical protein
LFHFFPLSYCLHHLGLNISAYNTQPWLEKFISYFGLICWWSVPWTIELCFWCIHTWTYSWEFSLAPWRDLCWRCNLLCNKWCFWHFQWSYFFSLLFNRFSWFLCFCFSNLNWYFNLIINWYWICYLSYLWLFSYLRLFCFFRCFFLNLDWLILGWIFHYQYKFL